MIENFIDFHRQRVNVLGIDGSNEGLMQTPVNLTRCLFFFAFEVADLLSCSEKIRLPGTLKPLRNQAGSVKNDLGLIDQEIEKLFVLRQQMHAVGGWSKHRTLLQFGFDGGATLAQYTSEGSAP